MDMTFRETLQNKEQADISVEFMLYICKSCERSFSLPLLPEKEQNAFLFPAGEKEYYFLSFQHRAALYEEMQIKMARYAYPYLNFDGFDREKFLHYANERIWADLIDREQAEQVNSPLKGICCPYCGSQKQKVIGRLLACQGEEADFRIWKASLDGFCSLPQEVQNKIIILLLKGYADDYREQSEK